MAVALPTEFTVTGMNQFESWRSGTMPVLELVAPNTWSIPVPIPQNPLRYTLAYLLIGDGESVLVDPGWNHPDTWEALTTGIGATGLGVDEITGIVVTHAHPDHHGLSRQLSEESGAWIALHPGEEGSLPGGAWDEPGAEQLGQDWLRQAGVPAGIIDELASAAADQAHMRDTANPDLRLADDQLLPLAGRSIRTVWTPGHTPGHLCLHDEQLDLLLTGDHILPRISPNIGLQPHSAQPPLGPYLRSLEKVRPFESAEILPAHEWRFQGLNARVDQLVAHHEHRLDDSVSILESGPLSAWDTATRMSWSRGWPAITGLMRQAALAETLSHLDYLIEIGRVLATGPDETGATLYEAAPNQSPPR